MRRDRSSNSVYLLDSGKRDIELLGAASIAIISVFLATFSLDSDATQNLLLGGLIAFLAASFISARDKTQFTFLFLIASAAIEIGSSLFSPQNEFFLLLSPLALLGLFFVRSTAAPLLELIPASTILVLLVLAWHAFDRISNTAPSVSLLAAVVATLAASNALAGLKSGESDGRFASICLLGVALALAAAAFDDRRIWITAGILLVGISTVFQQNEKTREWPISHRAIPNDRALWRIALLAFGTGTACLVAISITTPTIRWQTGGLISTGLIGIVWLFHVWWREQDETRLRLRLARTESRTDPLTGVVNRRGIDERLTEEIARARRYDHPLSILMIDLDDFKRINDTLGHPAGDTVLQHVAAAITHSIRAIDIAGRYGGEEFLVILPETATTGAEIVAERIRASVETQQRVTVSIGITELEYADTTTNNIIARADEHLYEAKRSGKNRIHSTS